MCLAALLSSVGKGAKAIVAGPAGAAFAGPTFLAEYTFHRVPLSGLGSFFFELTSDIHLIMRQFTGTLRRKSWGGGGGGA